MDFQVGGAKQTEQKNRKKGMEQLEVCVVSYLTEERLQLGQSNNRGLNQNLAVVVVRALQTALQTL